MSLFQSSTFIIFEVSLYSGSPCDIFQMSLFQSSLVIIFQIPLFWSSPFVISVVNLKMAWAFDPSRIFIKGKVFHQRQSYPLRPSNKLLFYCTGSNKQFTTALTFWMLMKRTIIKKYLIITHWSSQNIDEYKLKAHLLVYKLWGMGQILWC